MDKIHISGEKMLSIINNILQFSQIENNQIHIEETSVQTEKNFDSCIVMVQTALEEKQQHFHVTKDISYPYIYIDTTYMSEIVLNILSNAIKYTAKGGTISCALRQEPGETDGWCITEIAITIPASAFPRNSSRIFLNHFHGSVLPPSAALKAPGLAWES